MASVRACIQTHTYAHKCTHTELYHTESRVSAPGLGPLLFTANTHNATRLGPHRHARVRELWQSPCRFCPWSGCFALPGVSLAALAGWLGPAWVSAALPSSPRGPPLIFHVWPLSSAWGSPPAPGTDFLYLLNSNLQPLCQRSCFGFSKPLGR